MFLFLALSSEAEEVASGEEREKNDEKEEENVEK